MKAFALLMTATLLVACTANSPSTQGPGTLGRDRARAAINEQYRELLGPPSVQCWSIEVTRIIPARAPTHAVEESCAQEAGPVMAHTPRELLDFVVGRWVPCGPQRIWAEATHAGIELGGNKRWRFLDEDTGVLVPSANQVFKGTFEAVYETQLNLTRLDDSETFMGRVTFTQNGDRAHFENLDGVYARVDASPVNGLDHTVPIQAGACSLVGTWDGSSPGYNNVPASSAAYSFDRQGNWVGGPMGADLCQENNMVGTYQLTAERFDILTGDGMGCPTLYSAGYTPVFSEDCNQVTLARVYDNCTGGRRYMLETTTLQRRG
jgi:hypothetical protein